jgi:hypothetical protein
MQRPNPHVEVVHLIAETTTSLYLFFSGEFFSNLEGYKERHCFQKHCLYFERASEGI